MIIRGATLIDGTGGPPRGPVDIVIEGNRITDVAGPRISIHPVAGLAVFLALLFVVFQALFAWAEPAIRLIEAGRLDPSALITHRLPLGSALDGFDALRRREAVKVMFDLAEEP